MYACMCMYVYVCMYMYACIYMYVYVCMYMYVCMYVCICMCVCMYVYVCVCIHVYWGELSGELSGGMSFPKREGELSGGEIVRGDCPGGIVQGGIVLHPDGGPYLSSALASFISSSHQLNPPSIQSQLEFSRYLAFFLSPSHHLLFPPSLYRVPVGIQSLKTLVKRLNCGRDCDNSKGFWSFWGYMLHAVIHSSAVYTHTYICPPSISLYWSLSFSLSLSFLLYFSVWPFSISFFLTLFSLSLSLSLSNQSNNQRITVSWRNFQLTQPQVEKQ